MPKLVEIENELRWRLDKGERDTLKRAQLILTAMQDEQCGSASFMIADVRGRLNGKGVLDGQDGPLEPGEAETRNSTSPE